MTRGPARRGAAANRQPDEPGELIEQYLDDVYEQLHGPARHARRVLAETEAHLRDSLETRLAAGAAPVEAEQQAVAAFGSVTDFTRGCNAVSARDRFAAFLRDVRAPAVLLVGLGFIAIGLSGAVDRILLAAFGSRFVFGDPPGTAYPASACQHWMSLHPHAASCTQAYLAEAVDDVIPRYFATGVLGLLVLGGFVWWSRRRSQRILRVPMFTATVGATVFGTAGALLMGYGLDRAVVYGSHGPGRWISAGGVALLFGLSSLAVLLRSWRGEAVRPAASSA